jgi:hypothetical protein
MEQDMLRFRVIRQQLQHQEQEQQQQQGLEQSLSSRQCTLLLLWGQLVDASMHFRL